MENAISNSSSTVVHWLLPREPVCLWLVPRNGSAHYIAPSLRLFVPNGLQAYHYFLFSGWCWQYFWEWLVLLHRWLLTLLRSAYFPSTWPKTLRRIWLNLQVSLQKFTQNNNFSQRHETITVIQQI
jgi:hypothetical protein